MMDYFKDTSKAVEACTSFWDMSGPWPVPKEELKCGCCDTTNMVLRDINFHSAPWAANRGRPHRCRLSFKCMTCSQVITFGVVVPEEMFYLHGSEKTYNREQAKKFLANLEEKNGRN